MLKRMLMAIAILLVQSLMASILGNLAAGMAEKSFLKLSANASLDTITMYSSLTYWTNSGVWDPIRKQIYWIGGPGTCCANPAWYKRLVYSDSTNTWQQQTTSFSGSGHGYDANALNPANGDHYFAMLGDNRVKKFNGTGWGLLPPLPFSGTTPSLTWFPEINNGAGGLVFMGDAGQMAWFNGTAWTTITGATALSGYDNFSEYNPVHKVIWLGGGTSSGMVHYKMTSTLALTRLQDAPFSLEGNACALHSCDPVTGLYIVTNLANNTWWQFDIITDTWTQLAGLTGKPDFGTSCGGNGNNQWQVPISDYGVILYFNHNTSPTSVCIYKHKNGTTVENKSVAGIRQASLDVSPNPVRGQARISLDGSTRARQVRVYDLSGKLMQDLTPALRAGKVVLNAALFPAGVYTVRAETGTAGYSKRIVVIK